MFENNSLQNPYASNRSVMYAKKAMVATSQPLAAEIGLDILKKGGNAIDAAIATAAALTVVEPTGCGIGGDAFALVWFKNKLHGLNASGQAPQKLTPQELKQQGHQEMPLYGWLPVTVPGTPASWIALSKEFGVLPFKDLLQPAIDLAAEGFPVSPVISYLWKRSFDNFKGKFTQESTSHWFSTFAPRGRAPHAGEIFSSPGHARTLAMLAQSECASFYTGELADEIDSFCKKTGGLLRKSDLENYQVEWVDPIKVNYRGYDVWEIPPNGQGIVALMGLNIAQHFEFTQRESV
ncbi:MAG: gamma-glutamyltranspeptidase/glutathione hydrolase, partial [Oceanospirillaceae bacterium]